jgi:predicted Zn-dependent peptidase
MLNLESTSSRMSHLARQELYADRSTGLDAMLEAIEAVSTGAVQRLAGALFKAHPLGVTVLGDVDGLKVAGERLVVA